jgi:hypothetical protein
MKNLGTTLSRGGIASSYAPTKASRRTFEETRAGLHFILFFVPCQSNVANMIRLLLMSGIGGARNRPAGT